MSRWTGSWLGGPASAGVRREPLEAPGVRLGLPPTGRGAVAGLGRR
ncbi:MAG: RDD family protein, partial [Actinomycetota bacterium]|nr:RDD family protein [Actinomycetota bacterium]